jgi:opacity protein-like surface antigen
VKASFNLLFIFLIFFFSFILIDGKFNLAKANDGRLYIAPKIIYSRQNVSFDKVDGFTSNYLYRLYTNENVDRTDPVYYHLPVAGGETLSGDYIGAMAFGLDLHPIWKIPLRVELEASTTMRERNLGEMAPIISEQGTLPNSIKPYSITAKDRVGYELRTILLNFFVDWHNDSKFTPYVGGGIGVTFTKVKFNRGLEYKVCERTNSETCMSLGNQSFASTLDDTTLLESTDFTWNINIGMAYEFTENVELDLSYRYMDADFKAGSKDLYIEGRVSSGALRTATTITAPNFDHEEAQQVVLGLRFSFH